MPTIDRRNIDRWRNQRRRREWWQRHCGAVVIWSIAGVAALLTLIELLLHGQE